MNFKDIKKDKRGKYAKTIDRKKVRKLIEQGLDDWEIAKKLGCYYISIRDIRVRELGLKKIGKGIQNEYTKRVHTMVIQDRARAVLRKVLSYLRYEEGFDRTKLRKISGLNNSTIVQLLLENSEIKQKEGLE